MNSVSRNRIIHVEARLLRIHPTAQRDWLVKAKVKKFEQTMDLDALGTFHAVEYPINGETALWIIDGYHRLQALLNSGMGDWPCLVEVHVDVISEARASDLFLKLNDRSKPKTFETFRNELQALRVEAVGLHGIVQAANLHISSSAGDGNIVCIEALRRVYALDPIALADALDVVTRAWGSTPSAVEGKIVEGVSRVFAVYGDAVDRPGLTRKLAKYPGGASGLLGHARGISASTGRTLWRSVADVVIEVHDRGRSTGRLRSESN